MYRACQQRLPRSLAVTLLRGVIAGRVRRKRCDSSWWLEVLLQPFRKAARGLVAVVGSFYGQLARLL